jgi:hypothetical protein
MARSALALLLAGIVAVILGVVGTATLSSVAVTSSSDAAKSAEEKVAAGSNELGQPEGYGSR